MSVRGHRSGVQASRENVGPARSATFEFGDFPDHEPGDAGQRRKQGGRGDPFDVGDKWRQPDDRMVAGKAGLPGHQVGGGVARRGRLPASESSEKAQLVAEMIGGELSERFEFVPRGRVDSRDLGQPCGSSRRSPGRQVRGFVGQERAPPGDAQMEVERRSGAFQGRWVKIEPNGLSPGVCLGSTGCSQGSARNSSMPARAAGSLARGGRAALEAAITAPIAPMDESVTSRQSRPAAVPDRQHPPPPPTPCPGRR